MKLTHEGILALVFVGAVLAMILISICISGFLNYIDKKKRKQHPMLFILQEQANAFGTGEQKKSIPEKTKLTRYLRTCPTIQKKLKRRKKKKWKNCGERSM